MRSFFRFILLFSLITYTVAVRASDIEFTPKEQAFIDDHPIIEFGYEPNWPPYEMYEDGAYKGIVGDYVKILEEKTGIDFQPIPDITWDQTVEKLKSGEVKTSICVGVTDERKEYLLFTKPYISSFMVIITKKDYGFVGGLKYLQGKTVTLPKNYYTGELIKKDFPKISLKEMDNIYEAIKAVSIGEADAFVGNLMVASYYIEHQGFSNLKVAAPTDYEKSHIALAATKDWPELVSIAQKVFDSMTFREHNEIFQRWINVRFEHGIDKKMVVRIAVYSGVIIVLIIGGFLFWNETLKKEIKHRNEVEDELAKTLNEISTQNDERKNLLNEIHHRIKNNLHMVSGLLKLQGLESGNAEVEKNLNEAVERITSIALVHDKIYKSEDTKNLSLKAFVQMLVDEIITSFSKEDKVRVIIKGDLTLKNTNPLSSVALIINELVTNSLKYAFKNTDEPKIVIQIEDKGNNGVNFNYSDNGKWQKPIDSKKTFGLSLIDIFTEQMGGTYDFDTREGTSYEFRFSNFYGE